MWKENYKLYSNMKLKMCSYKLRLEAQRKSIGRQDELETDEAPNDNNIVVEQRVEQNSLKQPVVLESTYKELSCYVTNTVAGYITGETYLVHFLHSSLCVKEEGITFHFGNI